MPKTRLVHSPAGYLRYMQMSKIILFAFVEGKECDPFVFGSICSSVCQNKSVSHCVCKANELPNHAGGKQALLSFYDYLRQRNALKTVFGGKSTYSVFLLDKDIDDILRKKRRSKHVIYTRYYDIQNEIFLNGQLVNATAAASSLDPTILMTLLGDTRNWCRQAAEKWKNWVVLCVVAAYLRINHQCNYHVTSQVQCQNTGVLDPEKVTQLKSTMLAKSGLDALTFEKTFCLLEQKILRMFKKGEQDRVFKGKWYANLLNEDIKNNFGHLGYASRGFESRITSTIAAGFSANEAWAKHYKDKVERIFDT